MSSKPQVSLIAGTGDGGKNWYWTWINQWPGVLRPWRHNWIDFTLIDISYEWDRMMGNAHEVNVVILGLGFHWSANFRRSDFLNRMISDTDQIKAAIRDGEEPFND